MLNFYYQIQKSIWILKEFSFKFSNQNSLNLAIEKGNAEIAELLLKGSSNSEQQIEFLMKELFKAMMRINQLEQENEQLKEENQNLKEKYEHNKPWFFI